MCGKSVMFLVGLVFFVQVNEFNFYFVNIGFYVYYLINNYG